MRVSSPASATTDGRRGFWARQGWKALLGLVWVIGFFGVGDLLRGLDADPAIPEGVAGMSPDEIVAASPDIARLADLQVRSGGIQLIVVAVLWTAIVAIPFRRGERWSWWSMWTFPAWCLAVAVTYLFVDLQPGRPVPPPAISGWVFFGLSASLLLVTRRGIRPTD